MKKGTVLLVEDHASFRDTISEALKKSGFSVATSGNGEQALERLQAQISPIDVILLDYSLPKIDGTTFLESLRANSRWASIPVIVLTALAKKEVVLKFRELGIYRYFLKSNFTLTELRQCVEDAVTERHSGGA